MVHILCCFQARLPAAQEPCLPVAACQALCISRQPLPNCTDPFVDALPGVKQDNNSLAPYDDVFGLARFRETELIHGRQAVMSPGSSPCFAAGNISCLEEQQVTGCPVYQSRMTRCMHFVVVCLPASIVVSLAACLLQAAAPCLSVVSSWLFVWSFAWLLRLRISWLQTVLLHWVTSFAVLLQVGHAGNPGSPHWRGIHRRLLVSGHRPAVTPPALRRATLQPRSHPTSPTLPCCRLWFAAASSGEGPACPSLLSLHCNITLLQGSTTPCSGCYLLESK